MKLKQLARISILFFLISFISVSGIVYVGKNYESRYVNVNNETSNVNLGSYNLTCAWCTCSVNASNIQNEPWTAIITDVNATANTKAFPGTATCTGSNVVQNVTTTTSGVTSQCITVVTNDQNNYTSGIGFSTTGATETLNMAIIGRTNLTASFTDNDTTYTNGSGLTLLGTTFNISASGITPSTYGSTTKIPVCTFDNYGRATSCTNATAAGDITGVTAGTGLTGGGTSGALTINLSANTCGTGNYSYYNSTGFNCRSDIDIDTDSWWSLSSDLYNCSGSLCLNMSKLNISMDARFNPLISERMINSSVYSLVAERMLNSTTYTLIGERVLNSSLSNYMTNASINALISERVLNATLNSYVTASAFDASQTAQNTTIASKIDQTYGNATYALIGSVGGNPFDQVLNTTSDVEFGLLNISDYITMDYHTGGANYGIITVREDTSDNVIIDGASASYFFYGIHANDWSNVSITESQISDFGSYGTSNLTLSEVSTYGNSTYGLLSVQNIIGNNISSLMIANVSANNRITSLNSTKVTIGTNADLYINQSRVINWFSGCPANSWITNITNGSSVCTALIPVSPYLSFSSNWNIALNETKLNSTVDNKLSSYVTSSTLSNYMQNSTTYAAISERALNSTVALYTLLTYSQSLGNWSLDKTGVLANITNVNSTVTLHTSQVSGIQSNITSVNSSLTSQIGRIDNLNLTKLQNNSNANLSSLYIQNNITNVNCIVFINGGRFCAV